ncbi:MAG TPA: acyltransferase [Steroidobacteraceae bacterium]|jgi:peptidoglycan/LPS O-acetylase OafA/YrhL|nr:acyltransferase [Steroidobacteraceae bacterium]
MPKTNNFDLIRLAAAMQVAITHVIAHFIPASRDSGVLGFIELFPGVPIFFFISGFLISKSYEKNPDLREYGFNRFLRIYPGLAVCFCMSLITVWLTGYFATVTVALSELLLWVLAQLTAFQFYNPVWLRQYGVGVLNGSMWTITVELQFYMLVPIVYVLLRGARATKRRTNGVLLALAFVFWVINRLCLAETAQYAHALWFKLLDVSFLPWFYMFLVGVLFQKNFEVLSRWLAGKFVYALMGYCALAIIGTRLLGWNVGNALNVVLFLALAVATFSAAFSCNWLSDKTLRRNDLSYGVYIYHMPVANTLLAVGLGGRAIGFPCAIFATLLCAYASWRLIEKPALHLKRHPLYQHDRQGDARAVVVNS